MPVLPKSLFVLGAGFQTARTARKLKRVSNAVPEQLAVLRTLIPKLAATELGRDCGIEVAMKYEQFKTRAPIRTFEQLSPHIERMKRGESGILWPGQCAFYAQSSGSGGEPKSLPVTEEMLNHFRTASIASVLHYSARVGHSGVFRGRHLWLGGSTALRPLPKSASPFLGFTGDISAITNLNLPSWCEKYLYEPAGGIGQIADWQKRLDAIIARTRALDITLLGGLPSWLLIFAETMLKKAGAGNLQSIWPNLECVMHAGVPLAPFEAELRRAIGPAVKFHEVYAASEGIFAAQDAATGNGLRLLADAGIFYEFIPAGEFDNAAPQNSASRAVPLEGVRVGEDYVLLVTTPAGLCRYVVGDVVRFTSTTPPRLMYVGRTTLQLNAFGERVIEKELTDSLIAVCQRHNWSITNFHVAPLFINSLTGQNRGRHEWWIELRAGTIETPTGPALAGKLDAELLGRNKEYALKRKMAALEAPVVRLVMPGFFEHWMRHQGKWGGHSKMPRARSDRHIADELSQIACFTED